MKTLNEEIVDFIKTWYPVVRKDVPWKEDRNGFRRFLLRRAKEYKSTS